MNKATERALRDAVAQERSTREWWEERGATLSLLLLAVITLNERNYMGRKKIDGELAKALENKNTGFLGADPTETEATKASDAAVDAASSMAYYDEGQSEGGADTESYIQEPLQEECHEETEPTEEPAPKKAAGVSLIEGFGYFPELADFDLDGRPDIVISVLGDPGSSTLAYIKAFIEDQCKGKSEEYLKGAAAALTMAAVYVNSFAHPLVRMGVTQELSILAAYGVGLYLNAAGQPFPELPAGVQTIHTVNAEEPNIDPQDKEAPLRAIEEAKARVRAERRRAAAEEAALARKASTPGYDA